MFDLFNNGTDYNFYDYQDREYYNYLDKIERLEALRNIDKNRILEIDYNGKDSEDD